MKLYQKLLVFRSLICNFGCAEGTFARQSKFKHVLFAFVLAYSYLCRMRWRPMIIMLLLCLSVVTLAGEQSTFMQEWKAGSIVSLNEVEAYGIDNCFVAEEISDEVFERMQGKSYKKNCTIPRSQLRYLRLLHKNNKGQILLGEMVCNVAIANDLVEIFRQLYEASYPIERMVLIDDYNADDETSMRANNTSCFNYRTIAGSKKLSHHARGTAVDINTLYNPYYKKRANGTVVVQPATGRRYVNRKGNFPYKIVRGDLCYRLFIQHGFTWGGAWRDRKDYQHFEKSIN